MEGNHLMNFAQREAARLAAAQAQATEEAKAGMKAPGADMVAVFSIAGFELADIFAEWARRSVAEGSRDTPRAEDWAGGLGPSWQMPHETPEAFGQRVARAVLKLLKEV
jgi:hypothetical protein